MKKDKSIKEIMSIAWILVFGALPPMLYYLSIAR